MHPVLWPRVGASVEQLYRGRGISWALPPADAIGRWTAGVSKRQIMQRGIASKDPLQLASAEPLNITFLSTLCRGF